MFKDFDKWNAQKKKLDKQMKILKFREGEIWWCKIGLNLNEESCGKGTIFTRPVLIIKKLSNTTVIVVPLTTKIKSGTWFCSFTLQSTQATCQLNQIRMISTSRLCNRLHKVNKLLLTNIKAKLFRLLS